MRCKGNATSSPPPRPTPPHASFPPLTQKRIASLLVPPPTLPLHNTRVHIIQHNAVAEDDVAVGDPDAVGTVPGDVLAQLGGWSLQHRHSGPLEGDGQHGPYLDVCFVPAGSCWEHFRPALGGEGELPLQSEQHSATDSGGGMVRVGMAWGSPRRERALSILLGFSSNT